MNNPDVYTHYVGIDVSKKHLDVSCPSLGIVKLQVPNTGEGFEILLETLADRHPQLLQKFEVCFVCEQSGGYEKALRKTLQARGLACALPNPASVRNFAKSCGAHAKTDPVDAKVLSAVGDKLHPRTALPLDPAQEKLQELVRQRADFQAQLRAETNRLEHLEDRQLRQLVKRHIKGLETYIAKTEALIKAILAQNSLLQRKVDCLCQIPGVGWISAVCLVAEVPELGQLSRKAITALVGLAPFNHDSGERNGRRFIRGGRASARKALYMPSLTAITYNPVLKEFYQRLVNKSHKPKKVALVAVMKKLLLYCNSLIRNLENSPVS